MTVTTTGEQKRAQAYERLVSAVRDISFTTSKQLRHVAEGAGFDFVPTDVVRMDDLDAEFVLRPDELPPIHVIARRAQPWHPYHVTDVRMEPAP